MVGVGSVARDEDGGYVGPFDAMAGGDLLDDSLEALESGVSFGGDADLLLEELGEPTAAEAGFSGGSAREQALNGGM